MRPTSLLWLFSSVFLLANAVPVPLDSSELANFGESDAFEVDPATVDRRRRDLDEIIDLEKRQKKTKAPAKAKPTKAKATKAKATKAKATKATAKPTAKPTKATGKPTKATGKPTKATGKPTGKPTNVTGKPTKATVKPTKATAKPTTKATTKATKTTSKPAATGTAKACPIKKKGKVQKRANFDQNNAPQTITITLDGKDFALTKSASQGRTGVTYTVAGTGDFAKTNFKGFDPLAEEIRITGLVGQLVAGGTDTNCDNAIQAEWIVTKKSPGKPIRETTAFKAAAADKTTCNAAVAKARAAIVVAHAAFVKATGGLNHNDLTSANVFFSDDLGTAFLIDFGAAELDPDEGAIPDDEILEGLEQVTFQDSFFCK